MFVSHASIKFKALIVLLLGRSTVDQGWHHSWINQPWRHHLSFLSRILIRKSPASSFCRRVRGSSRPKTGRPSRRRFKFNLQRRTFLLLASSYFLWCWALLNFRNRNQFNLSATLVTKQGRTSHSQGWHSLSIWYAWKCICGKVIMDRPKDEPNFFFAISWLLTSLFSRHALLPLVSYFTIVHLTYGRVRFNTRY